ncbi:MAG: general secretion pathway protein D [Candidatus Azotimanducaceae bacterium]|jgi:general secretion pathway protein D
MSFYFGSKQMSSFRHWTIIVILVVIAPLTSAENSGVINIKNGDIREFTTLVSKITGKSFILDQRVKGQVTVISSTNLDKDGIYELFLSVLRVHGYAAIPTGDVIKIVQNVLAKQSGNPLDFQANAGGESLITRVIPVLNTPSVELVKVLRPLIPQYGHIAPLANPNVLIISDHADNISRLISIIDTIDIADATTTRIIQLKEAWVEDMVALLEKLAPERIGKGAKGPNTVMIVANERTNSLVIKGLPGTLDKLISLIDELDVPGNRAGTIQVVRLAHSDAKEMAEILKNLVADTDGPSKTGQKVDTNIQADEALNALVIRADPATMTELKNIISQLDVRRIQVLIEAAIVEVTESYNKELGTELAIGDRESSNSPLAITNPTGVLASILNGVVTSDPSNVSLGTSPVIVGGKENIGGVSFAFVIQALQANTDVNLLSTPSITTMDNEEAKIVVGQSVPFRTGSTTTGSNGASNPFTTINREDVGLTLQVTPHVHDGNLIRLEVMQEVSEVEQSTNIGSDGSADLITSKRTIETTILADDGEIVVLGGLIRDKVTESDSGVPLLKDIPGLGFLFKKKTKKQEKQNLMVFLRTTVLTTQEDIKKATQRKYTGIWETQITGKSPDESLSELFDGKH